MTPHDWNERDWADYADWQERWDDRLHYAAWLAFWALISLIYVVTS